MCNQFVKKCGFIGAFKLKLSSNIRIRFLYACEMYILSFRCLDWITVKSPLSQVLKHAMFVTMVHRDKQHIRKNIVASEKTS